MTNLLSIRQNDLIVYATKYLPQTRLRRMGDDDIASGVRVIVAHFAVRFGEWAGRIRLWHERIVTSISTLVNKHLR